MTDKTEKKGPTTSWFYLLTGVYLAAVLVGAWRLGFFGPAGTPISPSDWGSVLAGVFSPLAFLWLIYASLSQRAELELQRSELAQNNLTQDAQRQEMQKQVEALTAQAKLLEAQAAATFDPVFVVRDLRTYGENYILLLANRGCDVMNVYMQGEFEIQQFNGFSTGFDASEKEVYYWPSDADVSLVVPPFDSSALHQVAIQYTRKDGAAKRNVYLFCLGKGSLRLVQSDQVMPSMGHV